MAYSPVPKPLTPELIAAIIDRSLELALIEHCDALIHTPTDELHSAQWFKDCFDRACAELGMPTYLDYWQSTNA